MKNAIDSFRGQYDFLSNFYQCPVRYEGILYRSSEHAYQAAKTLNMHAREVFTLRDMDAAMAKHLCQALSIRPNWDKIKLVVMNDILIAKFSDFQLKQWLLETGDAELIEGNEWGDTFWGVCRGKGNNFLGKLLMDLRKKLAKEAAV
jgi:N-glycosidase YbiA